MSRRSTKTPPRHAAGTAPELEKKKRICLGQIGAPHGLGGEVRLRSFTTEPQAIAGYGPLETEDGRIVEIESLRPIKNHFVARLSGISDRDAAAALANARLYVTREKLPEIAEADEFYHADLIGLAAFDRAGTPLGTVIAVHNFGAGDLVELRAEDGKQTIMLPFDATTVPVVDVAEGRIVVDLPQTNETTAAQALTRTAAGLRRQRSTLSRKGRG